ncbi:uncharacterized protein si:dkey-1h6.8 [Alosa alosa]|uniref:uncharacterized protein si:dkey-1h6.8 n=1 Tax=Alosa alosa TaxID=278164 RepID=UPI0020151965|nr:uncharacterized protein si:dkey-1h6.8 [Alosa alosa]
MATSDSDTNQDQQKVVLKRKLTGPPRLLLGKAKNVNQTEERSDARALRHRRRMDINGTSKDSTPPTTSDTLGEEGTTLGLSSENLQTTVKRETEGSDHARLQNDCTTCDAGHQEDTVKEQHLDVSRKRKKTTKEGLRSLFPHVFMCVKRRRDKHGDGEVKKGSAQSMECTGDDTQSMGDISTPGATCHSSSSSADPEPGTGTKTKKKRMKRVWFPFVGRHADKRTCVTKESQSSSKDTEPEVRKKTLRKRLQGFLSRRKKAYSSNQFECGATQSPEPERVERLVDNHLENNENLPRIHEEDIPERDGEGQVACPDTMTVSAEVMATSAKGTECESHEGDTEEPRCKMSEDLTSREDENELESCVGTQEPSKMDLNESSSLSDGAAILICVAELDTGFRPQIDIAMATDEVFRNGPEEIQLFDSMRETTGPDHDSLVPRNSPSNMSFLTVPGDGCRSLCEANSTDAKPCGNTFDCSLSPEDTGLLSGESLLILTANSLVRAAIKSALCQLSREIQPPLTNSHRDDNVEEA